MWRTDTYWFDVAIATSGLIVGQLFLGHFGEHKPRWRRLLKSVLTVALVVGTTAFAGRGWTYVLFGAIVVALVVVHGWWLRQTSRYQFATWTTPLRRIVGWLTSVDQLQTHPINASAANSQYRGCLLHPLVGRPDRARVVFAP